MHGGPSETSAGWYVPPYISRYALEFFSGRSCPGKLLGEAVNLMDVPPRFIAIIAVNATAPWMPWVVIFSGERAQKRLHAFRLLSGIYQQNYASKSSQSNGETLETLTKLPEQFLRKQVGRSHYFDQPSNIVTHTHSTG